MLLYKHATLACFHRKRAVRGGSRWHKNEDLFLNLMTVINTLIMVTRVQIILVTFLNFLELKEKSYNIFTSPSSKQEFILVVIVESYFRNSSKDIPFAEFIKSCYM